MNEVNGGALHSMPSTTEQEGKEGEQLVLEIQLSLLTLSISFDHLQRLNIKCT